MSGTPVEIPAEADVAAAVRDGQLRASRQAAWGPDLALGWAWAASGAALGWGERPKEGGAGGSRLAGGMIGLPGTKRLVPVAFCSRSCDLAPGGAWGAALRPGGRPKADGQGLGPLADDRTFGSETTRPGTFGSRSCDLALGLGWARGGRAAGRGRAGRRLGGWRMIGLSGTIRLSSVRFVAKVP